MSVEEQIKDLKQIELELENLDLFTKYKVYLTDICQNREKMIAKERDNIKEALSYIKPTFKKWILILFIISTILSFFVYYLFSVVDNSAGNGITTLLNDFLFAITHIVSLIAIVSFLYLVYKLISLPFQYYYYTKERKRAENHLKKLKQKLSYGFAKNSIKDLERIIFKTNTIINKLSEKHGIDKCLVNRENIPYIIQLMKANKDRSLSIKQICEHIVSKGKAKSSIPLDMWGELLLHYDKNFTYYQNENIWLEKYKQQHEKFLSVILFLPTLPLKFLKLQLLFLFAMFGFSKDDLKNPKHEKEKYCFEPENQYNFIDERPNPTSNSYWFYDSRGNLCEAGKIFYDSRGNLCEWGSPFYDGKDNYCEFGRPFYDAKGNYCDGTSPFYDWNGNLIDPN